MRAGVDVCDVWLVSANESDVVVIVVDSGRRRRRVVCGPVQAASVHNGRGPQADTWSEGLRHRLEADSEYVQLRRPHGAPATSPLEGPGRT